MKIEKEYQDIICKQLSSIANRCIIKLKSGLLPDLLLALLVVSSPSRRFSSMVNLIDLGRCMESVWDDMVHVGSTHHL